MTQTKQINNSVLDVNLNHTHEGYILSVKEYLANDDSPSMQHFYGSHFSIRMLILKGRLSKKRTKRYTEYLNHFVDYINQELTDYSNNESLKEYIIPLFNKIFDRNILLSN